MSVLDTAKACFSVRAYTEQAEPEADKDRHTKMRIPMDELVQYR